MPRLKDVTKKRTVWYLSWFLVEILDFQRCSGDNNDKIVKNRFMTNKDEKDCYLLYCKIELYTIKF